MSRAVSRDQIRVHVFARDSDLRDWLLDELALMSPFGSIEARAVDTLEHAAQPALLLVGLDQMTRADVEQLRELICRHLLVVGIGSPQRLHVPLDLQVVLDTKLTSKQLKRAVRDLAARGA